MAAVSASAAEDVERGQRACGVLNARRFGGDAAAQVLEDLQLALEDSLVGAEYLGLVLLERSRGEPFAAGDGLLALIVVRNGVQVRFGDLDVVAEDTIEADLQRGDAGSGALALLHLGDDLTAGAANRTG